MPRERIKLGTRAQVRAARTLDASRLLDLAKERAPNPESFDDYPPAFWQAKASSNRLDFYYTRMRPGTNKTLGNFVRGLRDGVSYQDSHNTKQNGLGHSLDGQLVRTDETDPDTGDTIQEVWGDFFTIRGVEINGQRSDDFIALISTGVWRDVSVGFFASDIECGLCGKQVFDWWADDGCPHLPGLEYETEDGGKVTAWAWINDGELSEVSQVYDGASPGAAVVKAEQMSVEGRLAERDRSRLERRYNTRIALPQRSYALGSLPVIGGNGMSQKTNAHDDSQPLDVRDITNDTQNVDQNPADGELDAEQIAEETVIEDPATVTEEDAEEARQAAEADTDVLAEERARLAPHGIKLGKNPAAAVRALADTVLDLRTRLAEKETLAAIGERYKADLIDATIAQGIRARGDKFREETYRGILANLDIDSIRALYEDFGGEGDAIFAGGRRTTEEHTDPPEEPEHRDVTEPRHYKPRDAAAYSA